MRAWRPDGNLRRYHYEDARHPHALTGVTDELGVRIGSYAYDAQARVTETVKAGGVDRITLAYPAADQSVVTDYSSGSATSRSYTFANQGGVLRPSAVSAPCPLCGNTAQASEYDALGNKTREVAHDGTVVFYKYNARGQETERATFPSSYNAATTRPALANASSVTSTQWHATWNLPKQVAEPGKVSALTYNAKGMLTGSSWTAKSDVTGAAKFAAIKMGSTFATGWGYNASSLNTSIVEKVDGIETQRWRMGYNAAGDVTRVTDVTGGNLVGRASSYDAHGRLIGGTAASGAAVSLSFNPRGQLSEYKNDGLSMRFQWTAFGDLQRIDGPGSDLVIYEYDSAERLIGVRKSLTTVARSESALVRFANALRKALESPVPAAHAQPLPPLTPVQGGVLARLGLVRPPLPVAPGDVLMPAQSPPDPIRELARRLGESVRSVVDKLLCTPECKLLQAQIDEWTGSVRKRYFEMVVDKNNLYCTRPEGRNSWAGHQRKYSADQTTLRNLIARARETNCPYNPEADDWASRPPPNCPG